MPIAPYYIGGAHYVNENIIAWHQPLSKPCEILPCPSDFHDTLLAPVTFHSNGRSIPFTIINNLLLIIGGFYVGNLIPQKIAI